MARKASYSGLQEETKTIGKLLVTPYRRTNDEWKSCAKYLLVDLRDIHKAEHSPLRLIPVQKETITSLLCSVLEALVIADLPDYHQARPQRDVAAILKMNYDLACIYRI